MDSGVESLKKKLAKVEAIAEELLLAKQKIVDHDRQRNANREALTALRKIARKPSTERKRFVTELPSTNVTDLGRGVSHSCHTCGDYDGSTPIWMAFPGGESFVRLPYHIAHTEIQREQEHMEVAINGVRSVVKNKTLMLSEHGALSDKIGPSLVRALVTLKDKSGTGNLGISSY